MHCIAVALIVTGIDYRYAERSFSLQHQELLPSFVCCPFIPSHSSVHHAHLINLLPKRLPILKSLTPSLLFHHKHLTLFVAHFSSITNLLQTQRNQSMAFSRPRFATSSSSSSSSLPMTIFNLFFRILQFVFGVAVIGLYAADLHAAHKAHKYTDSKWGYAVAVGTLGAVTALVYILPRLKSFYAFGWDIILL